MNNPLISIIVPVYNVGEFITECLESIRFQEYQNIEVIVIDDGSTDDSPEICDAYAELDKRFKVIHQNNLGVNQARKNAVDYASGEYIGFVDGDDFIEPEMYRRLVDEIKDAEIVICQKKIVNGISSSCENAVVPSGMYEKTGKYNELGNVLFSAKDGNGEGISLNLYDKLFLSRIIKQEIKKVDSRLRLCEDVCCVVPCILEAQKISVVNSPLYNYRIREKSACRVIDTYYIEQFSIFYNYIRSYVSEDGLEIIEKLDSFFASKILEGLNFHMGLKLNRVIPIYVPPIAKFSDDNRFILYGAGFIGKSFYRFFELTCPNRLVAWVDKDSNKYVSTGYNVDDVSIINSIDFDMVIIATLNMSLANQIKCELIDRGVPEAKIYWEKPNTIVD